MTDKQAKERLLQFLDQRFFDPVLNIAPQRSWTDDYRLRLHEAQNVVSSMKLSYQEATTPADLVAQVEQDIRSPLGRALAGTLHDLDLPALVDFRDEFTRLAAHLSATS